MKIAISKGHGSTPNYGRYAQWVHAADPTIECIDLYELPREQMLELWDDCSGIIFSGGADIDPARFGKGEERDRCIVDEERDVFELELVQKSLERNLPVLGICRGMQLLNVALHGSLYTDIPSDVKTDIEHRKINNIDSRHGIIVTPGSILKKMTGELEGTINSAHHQALDALPEELTVAARSPDGIIEAIEWTDATSKGFLLGVQWHPERMEYENPFSLDIARHFLFEAYSYHLLLKDSR